MKPNDNCPYCGALGMFLSGYPTPDRRGLLKERSCGSIIDPLYPENTHQSSRCKEREALQKAEAKLKELKENGERIGFNRYQQLCESETESAKLRELLDRMLERDPYLPDYHLFRNEIIHEYGKLSKL
jgi:hypothetical protein